MTEKKSCLSKLTQTICVDLSQTTELLPRTEFRLSDLSVGNWFHRETSFILPDIAEKLGIDQERMLVAGDTERHLLIFKSENGLRQVLFKYGMRYQKNEESWFVSKLGISCLSGKRLVASAWKLIDIVDGQNSPVWKAIDGAVSYKDEIANNDFIDSNTALIQAEAKLFRFPWFTQEMVENADYSRVLNFQDINLKGLGMSFQNNKVCDQAGFSIKRLPKHYLLVSERKDDCFSYMIQKKLETDLL